MLPSFAHSTSAGQLRFVAKDFYGFLLQIGHTGQIWEWEGEGLASGGGREKKEKRGTECRKSLIRKPPFEPFPRSNAQLWIPSEGQDSKSFDRNLLGGA